MARTRAEEPQENVLSAKARGVQARLPARVATTEEIAFTSIWMVLGRAPTPAPAQAQTRTRTQIRLSAGAGGWGGGGVTSGGLSGVSDAAACKCNNFMQCIHFWTVPIRAMRGPVQGVMIREEGR